MKLGQHPGFENVWSKGVKHLPCGEASKRHESGGFVPFHHLFEMITRDHSVDIVNQGSPQCLPTFHFLKSCRGF